MKKVKILILFQYSDIKIIKGNNMNNATNNSNPIDIFKIIKDLNAISTEDGIKNYINNFGDSLKSNDASGIIRLIYQRRILIADSATLLTIKNEVDTKTGLAQYLSDIDKASVQSSLNSKK